MFEADLASRAVGMDLVEAEDGRAAVTMTVRTDMVNGHGIAHGGYVFLLADTAFACACNEVGSVTVAVGADITFLAPARVGDRLTATAELRTRRGRSGIYDVTVTRADPDCAPPQVLAEFRGRSRTLSAQSLAAQTSPAQSLSAQTSPAQSLSAQTLPAQTVPAGPLPTPPSDQVPG